MALSKENIQQLIFLQNQDTVLDNLKKEMDQVPVDIGVIRGALDLEKAHLNETKNKIITLEKKKKEKELEVGQKEESAKSRGQQLNQVKTNEAFKALQGEIDAAKAEANQIETEILEIMEQLDSCKKEEKDLLAAFKGVEAKANAEIAVHEAKLKELQGKFEAAKVVCEQAAAPVPPEAMKVYNHIRSRGKINAVVPMDGGLCSACRINLTPQVIIEVTKGKNMILCESCQRILYKPDAPAVEAPQAAAPAEAKSAS